MIYIINGPNLFEKEETISNITSKLGEEYNIKKFNISSSTKPDVRQSMLESLLTSISTKGLFSQQFCGIVSLPEFSKKSSRSKRKNNNENLFFDLIQAASHYCSQEKQLIIYVPNKLNTDHKDDILKLCTNVYVEIIDLKFISNKKEFNNFCSKLINEFEIKFICEDDKTKLISSLCDLSACVLNKKGELEDITTFTKPSDIIYNQQLVYSSVVSLFLWSKHKQADVSFDDCQKVLVSSHPKQHIYSSIENIFRCSNKQEVADVISELFYSLSKQEILAVLTTLKFCIWDYIKFLEGHTQTRNCKMITRGNLSIKDPLTLYDKIYKLRDNVTLHNSSYKTDLILFFWEHLEE